MFEFCMLDFDSVDLLNFLRIVCNIHVFAKKKQPTQALHICCELMKMLASNLKQ